MSTIYNQDYIKTTYKDNKTDYPAKLANFLFGNYTRSKILDIGCGNGDITSEIEKLDHDVYGIDWSLDAKSKLPQNRFFQCDLALKPYPFEENTFDFVFSKSVIEHMNNPEILFSEAYRMLKNNGTIITMVPSWKHSYKEAFYIDHTHITPFTKHSLKTLHELTGFKHIQVGYFYQLPQLWNKPVLSWFVTKIIQTLEVPYRPFEEYVVWPESVNKFIRFSQEAMILCVATKKV